MKLAIIGAGNVGRRLAKLFAIAGHDILIGSRDLERAQAIASTLGEAATGMTYADAAASANAVFLTTPWAKEVTLNVARELGDLSGKIVVDCTNPLAPDYMSNLLGHTTSAAEEIAKVLPEARLVKAFNTIFADVMEPGKQQFMGAKGTGFYCGDDPQAKAVVAQLIADAGFEPVDAGALKNARYLEPMAQLNIQIAYGQGGGTDVAFRYMRRQAA